MGQFADGKLILVVSLKYLPSLEEVRLLLDFFRRVSIDLYQATNYQHQIGAVFFGFEEHASSIADIFINNDDATNATDARMWFNENSMDYAQNMLIYPGIMVHELSHYLYDLRDEYFYDKNTNTDKGCVEDFRKGSCLMEWYEDKYFSCWIRQNSLNGSHHFNREGTFDDFLRAYSTHDGSVEFKQGEIKYFCNQTSHQKTHAHPHNENHNNHSCWEVLEGLKENVEEEYGLLYLPNHSPSRHTDPIDFRVFVPGDKSYLLVSISKDWDDSKLRYFLSSIKAAMDLEPFDINLKKGSIESKTPPTPSSINILRSFDVRSNLLFLGETEGVKNSNSSNSDLIPGMLKSKNFKDWKNTNKGIPNFNYGKNDLADLLMDGFENITKGYLASNQVMTLVTNGTESVDKKAISEILGKMINCFVKVFIINLGGEKNAPILYQIATLTGGQYFEIEVTNLLNSIDYFWTIMSIISGQSRENSGIVSLEGFYSRVDNNKIVSKSSRKFVPAFAYLKYEKKLEEHLKTSAKSFEFSVPITEGSTRCHLGVVWQNYNETDTSVRSFNLKIYDPNGKQFLKKSNLRDHHCICEIEKPIAGTWKVQVSGSSLNYTKFRKIGIENNGRIRLEASAKPSFHCENNSIDIRARLIYKIPLTKVKVKVMLKTPSGVWKNYKCNLPKDASPASSLYTLSIPISKEEPGTYLLQVTSYRKASVQKSSLRTKCQGAPYDYIKGKYSYLNIPEIKREKLLSVYVPKKEEDLEKISIKKDFWIKWPEIKTKLYSIEDLIKQDYFPSIKKVDQMLHIKKE